MGERKWCNERIVPMKAKILLGSFILIFILPVATVARDIEPFVSTDWLEQNRTRSDLTLLDIRTPERYAKGHIPGAVNSPVSLWTIFSDGLTVELPSDETLRELLGKAGITAVQQVVVINHTDSDFARSDAVRVAWTCILAGIQNVAVLDGGFNKWEREKKPSSTETLQIQPVIYDGNISRTSLVNKEQVLRRSRETILLDTRIPEDYFGITDPNGHIKGAKNLPIPWQFTSAGAIIPVKTLQAIIEGVAGNDKAREIIIYCGVGGFAAAEWYIMTEVLGYRNVKVYDGSWEEWLQDPTAPVTAYQWE